MNPSITVVIPTYNNASSIRKAIESVEAQQWPDLEMVIVNDGSTDSTTEVLDELINDHIRVINQPNSGPAEARNTGIREARGRWIAFLDADDLWMPEKLSTQFCGLQEHSDIRFSFSDFQIEYPGERIQEMKCCPENSVLLVELLIANVLATPTLIVHADCFQTVGLFDTTMRTGEDWDMWLRLATRYKHAYLPHPLVKVNRPTAGPNLTKYPLEMLENCTERVLFRLFSSQGTECHWPGSASVQRQVYAWQYSVLAKSYLQQRQFKNFCRLSCKAIRAHSSAFSYLAQRGRAATDTARVNMTDLIGIPHC